MSSFIKEIEVIGIQMRMIALNACVHAARIGCDGEVLGVLAESIHQLSVDTAGQIASISGSLKAIVDETGSLSCGTLNSGEAGLLRREGDTGHVHEVLAPLHRMDEEISALLSRIDREGSSLSEDIERAIGENRAQERMERGISEVVSGLTKMIDEMKALVPAADREQKKQALAGLAERYTMEQERQIHRSVAASLPLAAASSLVAEGGAEQGAELGGQEVPASGGEEFGDNVELF
jgi:methyl-accepting chemotaxis protein